MSLKSRKIRKTTTYAKAATQTSPPRTLTPTDIEAPFVFDQTATKIPISQKILVKPASSLNLIPAVKPIAPSFKSVAQTVLLAESIELKTPSRRTDIMIQSNLFSNKFAEEINSGAKKIASKAITRAEE